MRNHQNLNENVSIEAQEPLPEWQRIELDRRLEDHIKNPHDVISLEEVRKRMKELMKKNNNKIVVNKWALNLMLGK